MNRDIYNHVSAQRPKWPGGDANYRSVECATCQIVGPEETPAVHVNRSCEPSNEPVTAEGGSGSSQPVAVAMDGLRDSKKPSTADGHDSKHTNAWGN